MASDPNVHIDCTEKLSASKIAVQNSQTQFKSQLQIEKNKALSNLQLKRRTLNDLKIKIEKLQSDLIALNDEQISMEKDVGDQKKEFYDKRAELFNLTSEKDALEQKMSKLLTKIGDKQSEAKQIETCNQEMLERETKFAQTFRRNLGFRIQTTSKGSLVLVFTQIDKSDPDKEFLIELSIQDDKYLLHRSVPPIKNLKDIEDQLNSANNFLAFLIYVRDVFIHIRN